MSVSRHPLVPAKKTKSARNWAKNDFARKLENFAEKRRKFASLYKNKLPFAINGLLIKMTNRSSYPLSHFSYYYRWFIIWHNCCKNNSNYNLLKDIKSFNNSKFNCGDICYYLCCCWVCDCSSDVESNAPSWNSMLALYDQLTPDMVKTIYMRAYALMHDIKGRIIREYHRKIAEQIFAEKDQGDLSRMKYDIDGCEWFYSVMTEVANKINTYNEAFTSVNLSYGISLTKAELRTLIASIGLFYPCIFASDCNFDDNAKTIIKQAMYEFFTNA